MSVNGIEIAVGQQWRMRSGEVVKVIGNDGHRNHPWDLDNETCVDRKGYGFSPAYESPNDLVELLVDQHGRVNPFRYVMDGIGLVQARQDTEEFTHDCKEIADEKANLLDGTKPTNPKDLIGSGKLPLHLWPATATAMGSIGMLEGATKYGRSNFRAIGVRASIYVDAAKRHIDAWFEGEDFAPDSGVPHLANALSCLAIIVDAQAAGKLTDDRMVAGGYRDLVDRLTPHVARLKELHQDKNPKHYTIEDAA